MISRKWQCNGCVYAIYLHHNIKSFIRITIHDNIVVTVNLVWMPLSSAGHIAKGCVSSQLLNICGCCQHLQVHHNNYHLKGKSRFSV